MENIIIENSLIKKELNIKSKKIAGFTVTNNLSKRTLTSLENSEEFILRFKYGIRSTLVKASELKISDWTCKEDGDNKEYRISFKPFRLRDSKISAVLVYTLSDFRCYMRKYLELSYEEKGRKKIILDSIAFESLRFDSSYKFWTLPEQKDTDTPGFALSLGQPVYVDSLYMGYEFPVAINKVENYCAEINYYSGKTLSELIGADKYVTYKSVIGGSESDIFEQVQKSFYEYIKDISKPVYLRRQYNSWFDNMLNITKENVTDSFLEIDKALVKSGEPRLDSYVIDDGWNDYGKDFWSFNSKFPDELYPFRNLAKGLGSQFGLWLGPRGGYTTDTIKFARKIQAGGNGYVNKWARDICVSSNKYATRTGELLADFQKRFDINYFKLDGFAQRPCKCKRHDHLTGGFKDIYFYSDTWERWIKIFEKLSLNGGSDFWINLTCYAWPSPWFLQWVNSVWMQISIDVGFTGKKDKVSDKDRMLSYRDEKYLDFYQVRQFQFPQRAVYNHDPIYGNEAKVSMTDDEFREYLFTMATRGTQFWELYYSYKMMNEAKWRINYACLRFLEDNIDILANSIVFGGKPSQSKVYGYSCFGDHEGIVSLRNSANYEQSYTLRLDELIGVKKSFAFGEMYMILPYTVSANQGAYSYGDTLTVTLAPYQTKIMHFGKKKKELKVSYVKALSQNKLELQFNQTVDISEINCAENPVKDIKLLEDYMTVTVEFEKAFEKDNILTISSVKDIMGNSSDAQAKFCYYENDIISDGGIKGKGDFSIQINITDKNAKTLYKQGSEAEIYIGEDGFVRFKVGVCTLKSFTSAADVVQITAVRERNNVLKLYLNKNLDAGMPSVECELSGEKGEIPDGVNALLLNKALSYDEI